MPGKKIFYVLFQLSLPCIQLFAQTYHNSKFQPLGTLLPTPNAYRTARGTPGPSYWQQRVDYDIKVALETGDNSIHGDEWITYHNNSPEPLDFLWLQLDENQHNNLRSAGYRDWDAVEDGHVSYDKIGQLLGYNDTSDNGYGDVIESVTDEQGHDIPYIVNHTMMRLDLSKPVATGQSMRFHVRWHFKMTERSVFHGRGGYEYFKDNGNYIYTVTQWYPRLCALTDYLGWENQQFVGNGEFALTFGKFHVSVTLPSDMVVAATGECRNYKTILSPTQYQRWLRAQHATAPVDIITLDEARKNEFSKSTGVKTWVYDADSVRDFAWSASKKFVWDAMPVYFGKRKVLCMSFYGKEAYNLYHRFGTKTVANTVLNYSKYTFPYPYPVIQCVEASNGMEYPMISFTHDRDHPKGDYSEDGRNSMIAVVTHEIGHQFFPMVVNTDERQWGWMDEGLNSYLEYLTLMDYDPYLQQKRGGPAWSIVPYMSRSRQLLEPVMSRPDDIIDHGQNVYNKAATGLNILRETILGRSLFDTAFKAYCQRWMFKSPTPADFFRTFKDATAMDLDWFWRGWFYTTEPCDIAIDSIVAYRMVAAEAREHVWQQKKEAPWPLVTPDITRQRDRLQNRLFLTDRDTTIRDFYWYYDRGLKKIDTSYYEMRAGEKGMPDTAKEQLKNTYLYEVSFSNKGGLVMPILLQLRYLDNSVERKDYQAFIWRKTPGKVTILLCLRKELASIQLDPDLETADMYTGNNFLKVPASKRDISVTSGVWEESESRTPMADSGIF